jgi:hypothetical protein
MKCGVRDMERKALNKVALSGAERSKIKLFSNSDDVDDPYYRYTHGKITFILGMRLAIALGDGCG